MSKTWTASSSCPHLDPSRLLLLEDHRRRRPCVGDCTDSESDCGSCCDCLPSSSSPGVEMTTPPLLPCRRGRNPPGSDFGTSESCRGNDTLDCGNVPDLDCDPLLRPSVLHLPAEEISTRTGTCGCRRLHPVPNLRNEVMTSDLHGGTGTGTRSSDHEGDATTRPTKTAGAVLLPAASHVGLPRRGLGREGRRNRRESPSQTRRLPSNRNPSLR